MTHRKTWFWMEPHCPWQSFLPPDVQRSCMFLILAIESLNRLHTMSLSEHKLIEKLSLKCFALKCFPNSTACCQATYSVYASSISSTVIPLVYMIDSAVEAQSFLVSTRWTVVTAFYQRVGKMLSANQSDPCTTLNNMHN